MEGSDDLHGATYLLCILEPQFVHAATTEQRAVWPRWPKSWRLAVHLAMVGLKSARAIFYQDLYLQFAAEAKRCVLMPFLGFIVCFASLSCTTVVNGVLFASSPSIVLEILRANGSFHVGRPWWEVAAVWPLNVYGCKELGLEKFC